MPLDLKLMAGFVSRKVPSFLQVYILPISVVLCLSTYIITRQDIASVIPYLSHNIFRVSAAAAIVLLDIKLYLYLYWSDEDLMNLRIRGPKAKSDWIFYSYLLVIGKLSRLCRNIRETLIPVRDRCRWQEVEASFMKRGDPRGSSCSRDHIYFQRKITRVNKLLMVEWEGFKEIMEDVFGPKISDWKSNILQKLECLRSSLCFPRKFVGMFERVHLMEKIYNLWNISLSLLLLVKTHVEESFLKVRSVPTIKVMLYDVLPLAVSIVLLWNLSIFVLYLFEEHILSVMQPFPDWRILMAVLFVPVILTTLLHRSWKNEELREIRIWGSSGLLESLIVYYLPLDDMVYSVLVFYDGMLLPSRMFEIDQH